MSVKNKTLRAFLNQNENPTIQKAWDNAWNYQKARLEKAEARISELEEAIIDIASCRSEDEDDFIVKATRIAYKRLGR